MPYQLGATFVLEFQCEDPESGITSCTEQHGYSSGDTVRLSSEGINSFRVTAVNGEGTVWTESLDVWAEIAELQQIRVYYDTHRQIWGGWLNAPVPVTLTASTSGTLFPIRDVRTRIDGGEWLVTPGSVAEVPFLGEGTHVLEYYAMDEDYSMSTIVRMAVNFDLQAPELILPFENGAVFQLGELKALWLECGDNLSGVDMDTCAFDEGRRLPTAEPGEFTVTARAVDNAGNEVSQVLHYTVVGDAEPQPEDPEEDQGDEEPTEQPVPGVPAENDLGTLAFTGSTDSAPLALLAGGLILIGLAIAGGATLRRWERARD
jgi:hypothetical protein